MRASSIAFWCSSLTVPVVAQDLLTVTRLGLVAGLDTTTGSMVEIAMGLPQQRGLARDGAGGLWTTAPINGVSRLVRVDAASGAMAPTATLSAHPHALASANGSFLFAAAGSVLSRIDTVAGVVTTVGATGLVDLGAIMTNQGVLYGWDRLLGLVVLDPATGVATDVNPAIGNQTLTTNALSWMAMRSDGVTIGGAGALRFAIDLATGNAQLLGLQQYEIAGAVAGVAVPYGAGCQGGAGTVSLALGGSLLGPGPLTSTSTGHAGAGGAQYPGVRILGFSSTSYAGSALPLALDPLLGTQGCFLHTAIDATLFGLTSNGALQFVLAIPPGFGGVRFHLQHAVFEPVVGNMSWSQGVRVSLGP